MRLKAKAYAGVRYTLTLQGEKLPFFDLIETLEEMDAQNIVITDEHMIRALKAEGVLKYEGSKTAMHGAEKGPNYDDFLGRLTRMRDRIYAGKYKIDTSSVEAELVKMNPTPATDYFPIGLDGHLL